MMRESRFRHEMIPALKIDWDVCRRGPDPGHSPGDTLIRMALHKAFEV